MIQVANHRLAPAQRHQHLAAVSGPAVTGGGCAGMPDVKTSCSSDKCKVLAADMQHLTCNDFCRRSGRSCLAAWEEAWDSCNAIASLACDQVYQDGSTSDLLCMCSDEVVGLNPLMVHSASELELIWSDEFEGGSVDRQKWSMVQGGGGFGNQERQHYTDREDNARVQDGVLSITARCEWYGQDAFTSAKLTTEGLTEWGPGHRVDVRARMPTGRGTWPAIWMLPKESAYGKWPASGEIDIMEAVGCTQGKIYGTVHTGAYNHMRNTQAFNTASLDVSEWHTYSVRWEESGIEWYVDDKIFSTFSPSAQSSDKWPFNKEFYLILNLAVGGSWGAHCLGGRRPSCSDWNEFAQPQVMQVDYARVYRIKS